MPVVFDAATASVRTAATNPWTFTHTPVGTPRGVLLSCVYATSATNVDFWTSASYGGVAMTRITACTYHVSKGAGEFGGGGMFWLGSGIPTGAQTVSISIAAGTPLGMEFCLVSMTAGADTEILDAQATALQASGTTHTIDLTYNGKVGLANIAHWSARNGPADLAPASGCTEVGAGVDYGGCCSNAVRQTSAGTSGLGLGATYSLAEQGQLSAAALTEIVASAPRHSGGHVSGYATFAKRGRIFVPRLWKPIPSGVEATMEAHVRAGCAAV